MIAPLCDRQMDLVKADEGAAISLIDAPFAQEDRRQSGHFVFNPG
jgi:hypothetical protein